MGRANPALGRDEDQIRFDQLKVALKTIGLSKRHVAQTCQLLAAILHLGNLEFIIDRSRNEDAAVVRNMDVLNIVAEFLGVSPAALESTFSYKTKLVKKELCTVFLDPDAASDNRDDLAKTLYSLLFAWLNEHINQRLCRDDFATFIGLLDLPGPQNLTSRPNSLDQFCINFANERLQAFIQHGIFDAHTDEYSTEGIASRFSPPVSYFDNKECIRVLQTRPGGLIHIMDDQARRAPRKTDASMVDAFGKRWGNHDAFKVGAMDRDGYPTFTVKHYNGPVTYSAGGFLERNLDALNPDFVSLLRGMDVPGITTLGGGEGAGSVNPFVKGLFNGRAIATQAHPRNEDTIVAAQQAVKPMRAPSTRRKGTIRRMPTLKESPIIEEEAEDGTAIGAATASGGSPCVAGEFKAALDTLFTTLDETQAWYVFCINPNDSQLPNQLEGRSVKGQVRSVGLGEVAKNNRVVWEVGMTPDEFWERYGAVIHGRGVAGESMDEEVVGKVKVAFGLEEVDIVKGLHKVGCPFLFTFFVETKTHLFFSRFSSLIAHSANLRTTFVPKMLTSRNATACVTPKLKLVLTHTTSVTPTRRTSLRASSLAKSLLMLRTSISRARPYRSLRTPRRSSEPTCMITMNTTITGRCGARTLMGGAA